MRRASGFITLTLCYPQFCKKFRWLSNFKGQIARLFLLVGDRVNKFQQHCTVLPRYVRKLLNINFVHFV
jgi:hypothetical protein